MKIAVPRESVANERRIALLPDTIKRLVGRKLEVVVESGAGVASGASDADYRAAGAQISAGSPLADADVVVKIHAPSQQEVLQLKEGSTIISLLYPMTNPSLVEALRAQKVTALSLDSIPRTTLAQMMDVLSSQATIAGYRAVIIAAEALPKMFPMLMTAAGTISPARVVVLGAGVAGLQAIATARRLGAVVEAADVRKVVKEQVESIGARFIEVDSSEDAQGAGGYAKEVSDDYKAKQAALVLERLSRCDICITTALIPGRKAPILLTAEMVKAMRPGSVVVDMAAEQGGNCELTKPGERIVVGGVTIIGELNLASQMAVHASQLFSRNVEKLLLHLLNKESSAFKLDVSDEITRGVLITKNGEIVKEMKP